MADRETPVLLFDGDCGFCRGWVTRWQHLTGDRVTYRPYQEAADDFPQIPRQRMAAAVQLIEPDGRVTEAAQAVYRTLRHAPGRRWMSWCYERVPGFAPCSELTYRFVARHRKGISLLTRIVSGRPTRPRSNQLSRWLFIRAIGVIYFIAFVSLGVQIVELVGENGITPVNSWLGRAGQHLGDERFWRLPTLVWYDASDWFLRFLCRSGAVLSVLLIFGLAPIPLLIVLWFLYLSVTIAGGVFLSFQWDNLLLETGLLAVFFAPLRLLDRPSKSPPVSRLMLLLLGWLLFRLMFLSGVVKWQADETWRNLTALTVHYETQPLPIWTSWYAHHLPLWFHKASCAIMFAIEIGLPFFIFGPRRFRQIAASGIAFLMLLIAATGNYNFFNLLTLALCIPLLDDAFWSRFFPKRFTRFLDQPRPVRRTVWLRRPVHLTLALLVIVVGTATGLARLRWKPGWVEKARPVLAWTQPFRSINSYGLFANMTETRPEIVIEGSDDGVNWDAYEFYWKPGDLNRPPRWVQPHQPRLDWQMWFAALGTYQRNPWFVSLVRRMLEGRPETLSFFERNPFPNAPPRFIRARLYDYRFTDPQTRRQTGAWWKRRYLRTYLPAVTLHGGRLRLAG